MLILVYRNGRTDGNCSMQISHRKCVQIRLESVTEKEQSRRRILICVIVK